MIGSQTIYDYYIYINKMSNWVTATSEPGDMKISLIQDNRTLAITINSSESKTDIMIAMGTEQFFL